MSHPQLPLQALTKEGFSPYGWVLGVAGPQAALQAGDCAYISPGSDFWHEHLFDTGVESATQILWVAYRDDSREVSRLEKHLLTQQALIALDGEVVQVVARSGIDGLPDPTTLAAFRMAPGQGLCMAPHCWHATRVRTAAQVRCVMLTRASTTQDLVNALNNGKTPTESSFASIQTHRWVA